MAAQVEILGIRHHGPGSARSVCAALKRIKPDCVLIEGPPDANDLIASAADKKLKPPVALLVYAIDDSKRAVFYPFAVFSPEWQAMRYAVAQNIAVRFMDLPMAHRMAEDASAEAAAALKAEAPIDEEDADAASPESPAEQPPEAVAHRDPLQFLAEAAGYGDGELWWDHLVEHRQSGEVFPAICEAMTELRQTIPGPRDQWQERREAFMRKTIRAAQKEGFENIAVVCGAWHAPALSTMPTVKEDDLVLSGLKKIKTAGAWVPWTYGRLAFQSGYGAGIASPGWYDHLWKSDDLIPTRWMTRVARLLRGEDIDASSAHVIEAVRLAETLSAMRERPVVTLDELNEATLTVLCFGNPAPLSLIHDKLIVGERLGEVPEGGAVAPLQLDLTREQKRLRLLPDPAQKTLELDLRKPNDLERSQLLHRMNILGIPWGQETSARKAKGTFKEVWKIQWDPAHIIQLIESGMLGNTIYDAASGFARRNAAKSRELPAITHLLDRVMLAQLPEAVGFLMKRVETLAALSSDVSHMMAAVPALANVVRYGNVRKTDTSMVSHVVDGLVTRIAIGLPGACASLNDDAAGTMETAITGVHDSVALLQRPEQLEQWTTVLRQISNQQSLHGLIAGRSTRLLLDGGHINTEDAATRMGLALSIGSEPAFAASWVEGFVKGSGLVLLHDERLWGVIDAWITNLHADMFTQVLPLLRRSFAQFAAPERRQMGERVTRGEKHAAKRQFGSDEIDHNRAAKVLPVLTMILGGATPEAPK